MVEGEESRRFSGPTLLKTQKCAIVCPVYKVEDPENDTLSGGTSLYN